MICKAETSFLSLFVYDSFSGFSQAPRWMEISRFFLLLDEKKLNVTVGVRWKAADPTEHLKESGLTDAFRSEFSKGELCKRMKPYRWHFCVDTWVSDGVLYLLHHNEIRICRESFYFFFHFSFSLNWARFTFVKCTILYSNVTWKYGIRETDSEHRTHAFIDHIGFFVHCCARRF